MATATLCSRAGERSTQSHDTATNPWSTYSSTALASPPFTLRLAAASFPAVGAAPVPKRRRVAPASSFRLFDQLPVEVVERILAHLELPDLTRLRTVNRGFRLLLHDPRHYADIAIAHLPLTHPTLVAFLPSVLCGTRHLSLRSFPTHTLAALLPACSERLTSLDLSFSGVRDADLLALAGVNAGVSESSSQGPRYSALQNLRILRLKGCRRISTFLTTICSASPSSRSPIPLGALTTLDLSWSSLAALPLPLSAHIPALTDLALATMPCLALAHLAHALRRLPSELRSLDLSHLGVGARELRDLGAAARGRGGDGDVAAPAAEGQHACAPPPLRLILAGNDALTRRALAALLRHWDTPGSRWEGRAPVEVEHSPVLLESDDEDDIRRFVQMVAGVVMRGDGDGDGGGTAESGRGRV
ncbi:hypothetical protein JCM3770_006544 [Rhodotorula araucariae]